MIITQTVGQMTDRMSSTTIATQTPLPRTHLSFASLAAPNVRADRKSSSFEKKMLENELLLQTQRNALKMIDSKINETHFNEHREHKENDPFENTIPIDEEHDSTSQSHSPSAPATTTHQMKIDQIAMKMVNLSKITCR